MLKDEFSAYWKECTTGTSDKQLAVRGLDKNASRFQ